MSAKLDAAEATLLVHEILKEIIKTKSIDLNLAKTSVYLCFKPCFGAGATLLGRSRNRQNGKTPGAKAGKKGAPTRNKKP